MSSLLYSVLVLQEQVSFPAQSPRKVWYRSAFSGWQRNPELEEDEEELEELGGGQEEQQVL